MKYTILLAVFVMSCLISTGEVSKEKQKDFKRLVRIDRVSDWIDKKSDSVVLKVEYSSEDEGLDTVVVRVAVELADKEKKTYLVEGTAMYGTFPDNYLGEGYWEVRIPYGNLERLKVTAYAVENGVVNEKKFVPFAGKYDGVKTYEELTAGTTNLFPEKCTLRGTISVDDN